jgi:integrase
MGQRLTDKVVNQLPAPAAGNKVYYDAPNGQGKGWVAGFGARVTSAGHVAFIFNYRTKDGRHRRATIGSPPAWSTEAARKEAADLRLRVNRGEDPQGTKAEERGAPTVGDLCDRYAKEHAAGKRSAFDLVSMANEIKSEIGTRKVAAVTTDDIRKLHRKITDRGARYRANRTAATAHKMFELAIEWGWRESNPAKKVTRNREELRERYLTADEITRLTAALAAHPDQEIANLFRLCLFTGCRIGELLKADWPEFDLEAGVWIKPPANTKAAKTHRIPLSAPARTLLRRIFEKQAAACNTVFPNKERTRIRRQWAAICAAAGIKGLRIHDLRHSFASQAINADVPLEVVGRLLGHSDLSVTMRYAHLRDETLARATEKVGKALSGGLKVLRGGRR